MKNFWHYLIPIAALALFIAVMLSGELLKKPLNPSEDVLSFVQDTITDAQAENWDNIKVDIMNLEHAWEKIEPRIQFSVERDELYNIGVNIARLKGSYMAQDKTSILIELNELLENWHELTR